MNELDRKSRFRTILVLSCASFVVFGAEQMLTTFRKELFGLDPRSAGHNFVYNFSIAFPAFLLALILSGIALFMYMRTRTAVRASGGSITEFEAWTVFPALLRILSILYFIVRTTAIQLSLFLSSGPGR